ncbi:MAG: phosphate acetyltransferase [Christensenella sp.]|uniref:phosphate acetyltransferase n=1 Tax=Christensenella sp. TaxID=1935934 RepID=UPI002B1F3E3F|nr:phosphate acetyltransferase [Christensenella sp.]MEA5003710.1 phosphate acetyltransferase [Christensenella sp.]
MSLMDKIKEKAKSVSKNIVLPEGNEPRTIEAAAKIAEQGIAHVILLGDEKEIEAANTKHVDLSKATIINPATSPKLDEYAEMFYEMRKSKGITLEQAKETCKDTLYYAVLMIKSNDADGMVSGAVHSTGDTLRPALQVIKTKPGVSIVSSSFIMEHPDSKWGDDGVMVFADCAINIDPNADELAAIAIASADTAKTLAGIEPRVAMLSFSTKNSAKHPHVDKVVEATKIARELAPELSIDGELQADAALIEAVGQLKSPGSKVAGRANVLIFPDIQAGNIGYKLVQRLGGAEAIGPVSQGLARPVNDLSRGCSVEDIVSVVAITAVQAQSF